MHLWPKKPTAGIAVSLLLVSFLNTVPIGLYAYLSVAVWEARPSAAIIGTICLVLFNMCLALSASVIATSGYLAGIRIGYSRQQARPDADQVRPQLALVLAMIATLVAALVLPAI